MSEVEVPSGRWRRGQDLNLRKRLCRPFPSRLGTASLLSSKVDIFRSALSWLFPAEFAAPTATEHSPGLFH
jgi:hypothetical protein